VLKKPNHVNIKGQRYLSDKDISSRCKFANDNLSCNRSLADSLLYRCRTGRAINRIRIRKPSK